jgi:hypothetical protein
MRILSGLNTLPAILNNRSTGAEEAGTDKYFVANFANIGNCFSFCFQYKRGLASDVSHSSPM